MGWGTLLLIAWRLEVIVTSDFLTKPGVHGRGPGAPVTVVRGVYCSLLPVGFAGDAVGVGDEDCGRERGACGCRGGGHGGIQHIGFGDVSRSCGRFRHTIFIWFFAYTFISFLPRAFSDMIFYLSTRKVYHVMSVILMPVAHMALKTSLGGSLS